MKTTPENIQSLKENEVFVFGSNLAGVHGAGAADLAFTKFGAKWGKGSGLVSKHAYAIPTKDKRIRTMPLSQIQPYVDEFISYVTLNPDTEFLVTKIGCGLAGYSVKEMASLFAGKFIPSNVSLPAEFWRIINGN